MARTKHPQKFVIVFESSEEADATAQDLEQVGIDPTAITIINEQDDYQTFLKDLELPAEEQRALAQSLEQGGTVLAIEEVSSSLIDTIQQLFTEYGEASEAADSTASSEGQQPTAGETEETGRTIPIIQEELQIGKRERSTGRVRVYSRVVSEPVEQQMILREERAKLEHRAVGLAIDPSALDLLEGQEIVVNETIEEPIVTKTASIVEEVVVDTEERQHSKTIHDEVRHNEVEIERKDVEQTRTLGAAAGSERAQD